MVSPDAELIVKAVAAPAKLRVVAVVFKRLKLVLLVVKFCPFTSKLWFTLVIPFVLPMFTVVASPNALIV